MKRIVLLAVMLVTTGSVAAQSTVNIQRPSGGDNSKSVPEGRSIAFTNTIMSVATGVAAVSFINNNTIHTTGAALAVYGIVVGPSTGNFYAQDYGRGLLGAVGRAGGAYIMVNATREIFGHTFADALNVDKEQVSLTDTRMLIGEALIVASAAYNLLSIRKSVKEYNSRWGVSMGMAPAGAQNSLTPVLTARYRF